MQTMFKQGELSKLVSGLSNFIKTSNIKTRYVSPDYIYNTGRTPSSYIALNDTELRPLRPTHVHMRILKRRGFQDAGNKKLIQDTSI